MKAPLFLAALAGGGFLLYRHLNPTRPASEPQRVTLNGHTWLLRPGVGFTDVYVPIGAFGATREAVVVRYATDTRKALSWAKNDAAIAAIADLGLSQA
jgi:hypothetical protein